VGHKQTTRPHGSLRSMKNLLLHLAHLLMLSCVTFVRPEASGVFTWSSGFKSKVEVRLNGGTCGGRLDLLPEEDLDRAGVSVSPLDALFFRRSRPASGGTHEDANSESS